jgi:hypothetical protein
MDLNFLQSDIPSAITQGCVYLVLVKTFLNNLKAFVTSSSHMNLYFPISHVNFETLVGFTKNVYIYSK